MTHSRIHRAAIATGLAATLAATMLSPAGAAPIGPLAAGVKPDLPAMTDQVRCNGCWVGAGVAAGVIAGAAIAGAASRPYYNNYNYGPGYYEPPVVYAQPQYYAPPQVYYAPAPRYVYAPPPRAPYGKCWVQTGYNRGYWGRC
ncbi:MAG TPA: hypothetical protein VLA00_00100 [Xanthobacteraceae bacterium]|nr:hypothetical protein [Xanthobacteraceae bacterium]